MTFPGAAAQQKPGWGKKGPVGAEGRQSVAACVATNATALSFHALFQNLPLLIRRGSPAPNPESGAPVTCLMNGNRGRGAVGCVRLGREKAAARVLSPAVVKNTEYKTRRFDHFPGGPSTMSSTFTLVQPLSRAPVDPQNRSCVPRNTDSASRPVPPAAAPSPSRLRDADRLCLFAGYLPPWNPAVRPRRSPGGPERGRVERPRGPRLTATVRLRVRKQDFGKCQPEFGDHPPKLGGHRAEKQASPVGSVGIPYPKKPLE